MAPTSVYMNGKDVNGACMRPATQGQFSPLVVVLVGLPARGKTVLSHKLERYLNWSGYQSRVFTLCSYLRKQIPRFSCDFVFGSDEQANEIRMNYTRQAINDTQAWLELGGEIAILDGTHATIEIRQCIQKIFAEQCGFKVLFIECILDDPKLIEENIKETAQLSEYYSQMELNEAINHIHHKIDLFTGFYTPICPKTEASSSYIKFYNAGENISVHRLNGPYQTKVLSFISCFRPVQKTIYFTRHGESEFNFIGRVGGDTNLSPRGERYAQLLAGYFNSLNIPDLRIWTSEKKRTKQTARGIHASVESLIPLNELDAGICEGMMYEEMKDKFPQEFAWRDQDKLRYRYPWGESYVDVMARLEPVLLELEREDSILVVSHQAVIRCIIGYFLNTEPDKLPYLDIPLHTVIKMTTKGYEYHLELKKFDVECVNTYREQPKDVEVDATPHQSMEDVLLESAERMDSMDLWKMEQALINS